MSLSTAEVESLRFHLGYGNLAEPAFTYTPDGFRELFTQVVAPNLTGDTETTATTQVNAKSTQTVTPAAMTGIVLRESLVIDIGDALEIVRVQAVTSTTFTAYFKKAHPSSGYPIAVMGGHARLRIMLHQADNAWEAMTNVELADEAGLKSVDKGDVVWFEGFQVLSNRLSLYKNLVTNISSLVRVPHSWSAWDNSKITRLEAY